LQTPADQLHWTSLELCPCRAIFVSFTAGPRVTRAVRAMALSTRKKRCSLHLTLLCRPNPDISYVRAIIALGLDKVNHYTLGLLKAESLKHSFLRKYQIPLASQKLQTIVVTFRVSRCRETTTPTGRRMSIAHPICRPLSTRRHPCWCLL
jgi:hypothetical protein